MMKYTNSKLALIILMLSLVSFFGLAQESEGQSFISSFNASESAGDARITEISGSSNFLPSAPPEMIIDLDDSSSYQIAGSSGKAWIRLDFEEPVLLDAIDLQGFLPNGALLYLQVEKEGILSTIPSGMSAQTGNPGLLDLSRTAMISDNLIINISGNNLQNVRLSGIQLYSSHRDSRLHKKELLPADQDFNRLYLNHDYLLVDGKIGTYWRNSDKGFNNTIYWLFKRHIQERYHSHERWRTRDDLIFDVTTPAAMEFLKFYVTDSHEGTLELSVFSEEQWIKLTEMDLQNLPTGWQKVDLSAYGAIEQVKLSMEDRRDRWNPGSYGGISEVELWGKESPDENFVQDIITPESLFSNQGALFDLSPLIEQDYSLLLTLSNAEENLPEVFINGYLLTEATAMEYPGLTQWECPIPFHYFDEFNNSLKINVAENEILQEAQLISYASQPFQLSETGLSDRRRYSGSQMGSTGVFTDIIEGQLDIEEMRLYFMGQPPEDFYMLNHGISRYLSVTDTLSTKIFYQEEVLADQLGLDYRGGIQEIEILGSDNEITTPWVKLIYPEQGLELPQNNTYHHKVLGITDCPDADIRVNGVPAQVNGNYFWVEMRDLNINQPNSYTIKAEVTRPNGWSNSDTVDIRIEDESTNLRLDQGEELVVTTEETYTLSGKVMGGYLDLRINGESISISRSGHFEKVMALESGLNIFNIEMIARDGQNILVHEERQVFRRTLDKSLTVFSPQDGGFTNKDKIDVDGMVMPWDLKSVLVNGNPAEVNGQCFHYSDLPVSHSVNTITVEAIYKKGETVEQQLTLYRDLEPPELSDILPEDGKMVATYDVAITGTVEDQNDVTVFVNGKVAELNGNRFSWITPLPLEGNNVVQVTAKDIAGNETIYPLFYIFRDTTGPEAFEVTSNVSGWTNNNRPIIEFSTFDKDIGLSHYEVSINGHNFYPQQSPFQVPYLPDSDDSGVPVVVRAYDLLGNYTDSEIRFFIDTTPPEAAVLFRTIPGSESFDIKWQESDPDNDTLSYRLITDTGESVVQEKTEGIFDEELNLLNYSVHLDGFEQGALIEFYLTSIDRAGNESEPLALLGFAGMEIQPLEEDEGTLIEYENVNLMIPEDSLPEEVTDIIVYEVESEYLDDKSINPIVSPIYSFSAATEDGILNHVNFDEPYVGILEYDENLEILENFPEQNLAAYYFDTNWSKWIKVPQSAVDIENNRIIFSTDHFTEFSIQPTVMEDVSPQELADVEFPMFSDNISHSPVSISPQGGSASMSMTEMVLPGKNGLDLEIRRIYDSATARGDAAGLNLFASISLSDILSGDLDTIIAGLGGGLLGGTLSSIEDSIEKFFQNNGDYSYSLGQGWRLNFPYLKSNNGGVMVRTPSGSFYDVMTMDVDWDKSVSAGLARTLTLENHQGEDFTLRVTQVRTDVNFSSFASGAIMDKLSDDLPQKASKVFDNIDIEKTIGICNAISSYQKYIPAWTTIHSTLYTKDGKVYNFDQLGRVYSISNQLNYMQNVDYNTEDGIQTEPVYNDEIRFHYSDLKLDYIEDTYGRKVHFEYDWVNGVSVSVPQISRIWVEGEDKEVTYDYEEDRSSCMGQNLAATFKLSLPLLENANDIGGRDYNYQYDDQFLLASNVGAKVNGIGLVLDICGLSSVSSALGISSLTIFGGMQMEWVFPVSQVTGPGIGTTKLYNEVENLWYFNYELCDYIIGAIPTGVSFEISAQDRPYYRRLERYSGNELIFWENYSFDFVYGGYKQFYNTYGVVTNEFLRTEYDYSPKVLSYSRFLDASDVIAGGLIQQSHIVNNVIPLNTMIKRYDATNSNRYIDTTTMTYDNRLRLTSRRTENSENYFTKQSFSYDNWGNQISIKTEEKTGDILTTQTILNQYQENNITGYGNPFGSLNLVTSHMHNLLRGSVVTESVSADGVNLSRSLDTKISWYDYNSYGQLIESRKLVEDGVWNVQKNEYYPIADSFESGMLSATINYDLASETELQKTAISYQNQPSEGRYRVTQQTDGIDQADGSTQSRTQWTEYEIITGNPVLQHDARGYETQFSYDNLDRITEKILPGEDDLDSDASTVDNPVISIEYDDDLLLTTLSDPLGATVEYQYDDLGRLLSITKINRYPDMEGSPEEIVTLLDYDGMGNIIKMTDPLLHVTEYSYDGQGRLLEEKFLDPENTAQYHNRSYLYVDSVKKRRITNENGFYINEYMDFRGNVIKREELDQYLTPIKITQTVFSMDSQPLVTIDPLGLRIDSYYNAFGNLRDQLQSEMTGFDGSTDFTGRLWIHNEYNNQGLLASEKSFLLTDDSIPTNLPDNFLSSKSLNYNGIGELGSETYEYYDVDNVLQSMTTKHVYNKNGNEVETIDGNSISNFKRYTSRGQIEEEEDALGNISSYQYDLKDRVTQMTGPRGNSENYPDLDFTIKYHYDDLDRLIRGELPQRADQTAKPEVILEYDARGNLLSRTEPDQGITTYEYNFRNWMTQEKRSGVNDEGVALHYTTDYSYDKVGNQLTVTQDNKTWTSTYDPFNRLKESFDPSGAQNKYFYDALDNLIRQIDGNGNTTWYEYNNHGFMTAEVDSFGYITSYDYDLFGNKTRMTDPRGNSWLTDYDELSRVLVETNSRNGSATYQYDMGGRLETLTDPNGTTIKYVYYDTGLPRTITYTSSDMTQSQTESYTYDEAGVVKTATIDGIKTSYNMGSGQYVPDPMGLITSQSILLNGQTYETSYGYDKMNRMTSIGYHSGLNLSQSWNNLGQLEEITDYASDFHYNNLGLLEDYTQKNGIQAEYGFDSNSRLSNLSYTLVEDLSETSMLKYTYQYDNSGNMTYQNEDCYGYDMNNRLISASITGDSLAEEKKVDEAVARFNDDDILGQVRVEKLEETRLLDSKASSIVVDYAYPKRMSKVIITPDNTEHRIESQHLSVLVAMFNNEGYYTEVEDAEISIDSNTGAIKVSFPKAIYFRFLKVHCHFNELDTSGKSVNTLASFSVSGDENIEAWAIVGGRNEFYMYDEKGNRKLKTIMATVFDIAGYTYAENSDLLTYDETYYYQYDNNGNLVEKGTEYEETLEVISPDEITGEVPSDYEYFAYHYDLKNRLTSVEKSNGQELQTLASYRYDIDGNRISKTDAQNNLTIYLFDLSGKVLEEITQTSTVDYVYLKDRHLARIEGDTTLFYGTDHLNTTVLMTDINGQTVWSGDTSPFGDFSRIISDLDLGLKYTGKDLDEDTGLYYFNARWYDAKTGRFISEDPIRDGLNWYAYCSNNPVNYVDPTGLFDESTGKVEEGDNLTEIREILLKDVDPDDPMWEEISVEALAEANGIEDPDLIYPGQTIDLPMMGVPIPIDNGRKPSFREVAEIPAEVFNNIFSTSQQLGEPIFDPNKGQDIRGPWLNVTTDINVLRGNLYFGANAGVAKAYSGIGSLDDYNFIPRVGGEAWTASLDAGVHDGRLDIGATAIAKRISPIGGALKLLNSIYTIELYGLLGVGANLSSSEADFEFQAAGGVGGGISIEKQ